MHHGRGTAGSEDPLVPQTLGRYTPEAGDAPLVRVVLVRLPVLLVQAGREHHDNLVRELRLLALSGGAGDGGTPERLSRLVTVLGQQRGGARARRDTEIDEAVERGLLSVDQVTDTPAAAAAAVTELAELLEEADRLCEGSLLLTTPRPPLLRRFSDWYLGEFVAQIGGRAPVAWDGPLRP